MKRIIKKTASVILVLSLLLGFSACGSVKPENNDVVMTLDGEKIYYDYYAYLYYSTRDSIDGGDRSYWSNNIAAQTALADDVLEMLIRNKAIKKLAEKYGMLLTNAEKNQLDGDMKELEKTYASEKEFRDALRAEHATEYSYRYVCEIAAIWEKVFDHVTDESSGVIRCSDEVLLDDVRENFRCIKYILIDNTAEGYLDTAAEIMKEADGGADFDTLIKKYGQDENMPGYLEHGRYYTVGEIAEDVEDAVDELDENEISRVLDLDAGCFIIKRLPIDMDYVKSDLESFRTRYFARSFNEMLDAAENDIKVEYRDAFSKINVFGE